MRTTRPDSDDSVAISAIYGLSKSKNANDLISHHRFVREYYEVYNNNREVNHNFVRGFPYDADELSKYRDKRKTPVAFSYIKTSERTILGLWLQRKYAARFTATSPDNDDIGEVLEQLNIWQADNQGDDMNDIDLVRQAWAGGNSFQECYMDVTNENDPVMYTNNQNPFAIYWDPDSRKLITREDAGFYDRVTFIGFDEVLALAKNAREKKEMREHLENYAVSSQSYEQTTVYADRDHETMVERNGRFAVIERTYKVRGIQHFAEIEGGRMEIDAEDLKEFKAEFPDVVVEKEDCDVLHLAIACEAFSNTEYVYNGKYHCNPHDPRTKRTIWPMLEMVAESLAGEPQSFVDFERSPTKVINAMLSNIVSSATHAAAGALLLDPSAFVSETEAKLAARHHSDSDRSFKVRPGRGKDAFTPIARTQTNQDHQYALNFAISFLAEVSSTPPSLQGVQESANTPASLNAQRIEQGFNQLQPLMKNYRLFQKQRCRLRYYYWRTYMTKEMTFKVIDKSKPEMEPFITVNQLVPEMDALGQWTGTFRKMKDINTAIYEVSIEEAIDSPTYRDKQIVFIEKMLNSGFVQSDPGLAAGLLEEALRLSDAPMKTREMLKKYSNLIQKANQEQKQLESLRSGATLEGQALDNQAKMQNIAQNEAVQTVAPGASGGSATPQPRPQAQNQGNVAQYA